MDIRDPIRDAMEAQGLTMADLARRAEVHYTHLLRYLAGERDMSGDRIARVLTALGLELVDGHVPSQNPA